MATIAVSFAGLLVTAIIICFIIDIYKIIKGKV